MQSIEFLGFFAPDFSIDFGDALEERVDDETVNGLMGLDVLTAGGFIIDPKSMELY